MRHCSVPGDLGPEPVEVDPEVIKPIDEVSPERAVEDILRKF